MSQTKAQLISDLVQALNFTGTASAPANGAFLSAANTLKLSTATNSETYYKINDRFMSGNVGIGTNSPDDKLSVTGDIVCNSGTVRSNSGFSSMMLI